MPPHDAMELVLTLAGSLAAPAVVEAFEAAVTAYPRGALVRLSDGRTGTVQDPGEPAGRWSRSCGTSGVSASRAVRSWTWRPTAPPSSPPSRRPSSERALAPDGRPVARAPRGRALHRGPSGRVLSAPRRRS